MLFSQEARRHEVQPFGRAFSEAKRARSTMAND